MTIVTEMKQIRTIRESQQKCSVCVESTGRTERTSVIVCDICTNWVCKDCANIDSKLLDFVLKNDLNYNYICGSCNDQIPKLKDLMKLSQKQMQLENDIVSMKADIAENKRLLSNQNSHEERLTKLEKIIEKNNMDDEEYPPLPAMNAETEKLKQDISSQKEKTTTIKSDLEEEKRKETIKMNLIIYGIPESENNVEDQMIADFNTLKDIYSDRVQLNSADFSSIIRLGKKNDKIRPIRITLLESQKRKEILTNNQGLRLESDEYEECRCRYNPGRHIHVNVTNDKTKQEREAEHTLREEMKARRRNGDDVIIRKGKIVDRYAPITHARWDIIRQNV